MSKCTYLAYAKNMVAIITDEIVIRQNMIFCALLSDLKGRQCFSLWDRNHLI